jgi:hypothetical protein
MSNLDPNVTDRRLKAEDFRSEAFRRDAIDRETIANEMSAGRGVNLRNLEEQIARRPIDEIAGLIRRLTYGEMMELAEELWKAQIQGAEILKDGLPGLLHRWSTTHEDEPICDP